jgi:hypothetical protein
MRGAAGSVILLLHSCVSAYRLGGGGRYALCVAYMNEKKEETNAMRTREKRTTT